MVFCIGKYNTHHLSLDSFQFNVVNIPDGFTYNSTIWALAPHFSYSYMPSKLHSHAVVSSVSLDLAYSLLH